MQHLADIKVAIDNPSLETGNLPGILSEIQYALEELLNTKTRKQNTHKIDLRAMPWSVGEEQKLEEILGQGKSIFQETSYSGVWLITHYNEDNELISKIVEITYLPDMVLAQQEDIKSALDRLKSSD